MWKERSVQAHILAADHLVLVVTERERSEAGVDPTWVPAPTAASEAEREVQRRLLADAIVGQRSLAVLLVV